MRVTKYLVYRIQVHHEVGIDHLPKTYVTFPLRSGRRRLGCEATGENIVLIVQQNEQLIRGPRSSTAICCCLLKWITS